MYKRNIDEYFIIDEACQEIFLKLLESRKRPGLNYYSFWKYMNTVVNNWMLTYLIRNKEKHFVRLTEEILEIDSSPEVRMIKAEESKVFLEAFSNLFNLYLKELWENLPVCALITESWIRRKKDFLKSFSECFMKSINSEEQDFEYLRYDNNDDSYQDQTTLYTGILQDILSVAKSPDLMKRHLNRVSSKKRIAFESGIIEFLHTEESKNINRIKQRISRTLAIIRVKMQDDLKDF